MPKGYAKSGKRRVRTTFIHTKYSDAFKVNALHALDANGGNVLKTARTLCIPQNTLVRWAKAAREPYLLQLRDEKQSELAKACEYAVWLLLGGVADIAAIRKATLAQRATAFGIVFDKLRLLQNEPTNIGESRKRSVTLDLTHLSPDQVNTLAAILESAGIGLDGNARAGRPAELPGVPAGDVPDLERREPDPPDGV